MSLQAVILTVVLVGVEAGPAESLGPADVVQPSFPSHTVRGDLLTIKGETYVIRGRSGVLMYLRTDKNTKKERLIVPGERIVVQVSPDGRALSIRPADE